jgi:gamma-glutamyl-gamma-aminobutyrate hydrolase PuuD
MALTLRLLTLVVRYILATAHISIILVRIINAFIIHGGKPLGATLYLANIAEPINRSKDMIYVSLVKQCLPMKMPWLIASS